MKCNEIIFKYIIYVYVCVCLCGRISEDISITSNTFFLEIEIWHIELFLFKFFLINLIVKMSLNSFTWIYWRRHLTIHSLLHSWRLARLVDWSADAFVVGSSSVSFPYCYFLHPADCINYFNAYYRECFLVFFFKD